MNTCEWLEVCDRPAVGDAAHGVLGVVPICQVCADTAKVPLIGPHVERATRR